MFNLPDIRGSRPYELQFAYSNLVRGQVLDIGQTHIAFHKKLLSEKRKLTVLDIRKNIPITPGVAYITADIRDLRPSKMKKYANVVMISTLEHVGLTKYGQRKKNEGAFQAQLKVLKNCVRLLTKQGSLILTVPFGSPVDKPEFQLFYNHDMIQELKQIVKVTKENYITPANQKILGPWHMCNVNECVSVKDHPASRNLRDAIPNAPLGIAMLRVRRGK